MSNEERLDKYLSRGGIYLEIYYLLLKLAKPASNRYRLKIMLDVVLFEASHACNVFCKQGHPEAYFENTWNEVRAKYKRYETDLIFSVAYTLLKVIKKDDAHIIPVLVEIEDKNKDDSTYFPHFKELTENYLKAQKKDEEGKQASISQLDALLQELTLLRKENEELKLRNENLVDQLKDSEFALDRARTETQIQSPCDYAVEERKFSFGDLLAYAKSRQSYVNGGQIVEMLAKFLRNGGTDAEWSKLDALESYLLNRDGGSVNIDKTLVLLQQKNNLWEST